MNISQKDKNEVIKLIRQGSEKEAHNFLKSSLNIHSKMARELVISIKQDLELKYRLHTIDSLKYREDRKVERQLQHFLIGVTIVGFTLISIAFYFIVRDINFIKNSTPTSGIVTEVADDITFYYQMNGRDYKFSTGSLSSDEPSYYEGQEVAVFVDPLDPQNILIDTWDERWHFISLLLIFGFILFLPGTYLMIKR